MEAIRQPLYTRDNGEMTPRKVVERVAQCLDTGDVDGACDAIDELFLDGAWCAALDEMRPMERHLLKKDIRGLIVAAYQAGASKPRKTEPWWRKLWRR